MTFVTGSGLARHTGQTRAAQPAVMKASPHRTTEPARLRAEVAVPIPLTPTVLVAGAASSEVAAFAALVAAVVAGSVIGNAIWFAAGRRFGTPVLSKLCRFSLSPDSCVARTSDGFGRWGAAL